MQSFMQMLQKTKHSANWSYYSATFTHSAEANIQARDSWASSLIQTQSTEIYNKTRKQSNRLQDTQMQQDELENTLA